MQPKAAISFEAAQHLVDASFPAPWDGAVRNVHGELLSETVLDFHGYEGRVIHMKVNPQVAGNSVSKNPDHLTRMR